MPIRILSYNIHKGIGGRDRRYRLDRILRVIDRERPDIVCLQEVDRHAKRSKFDNQPEQLEQFFAPAGKLFQFVFGKPRRTGEAGPAVEPPLRAPLHATDALPSALSPETHAGYGNLLLSRWPFLEQHQISLSLPLRKPRGAQWAVIDTPSGLLRVVNWHLGLAERERHWQVRRLLEHHLFRTQAHLPTLIIGDTNDWRNTLAQGPFAVHGFQLVTSPPSRFRSFPAYLPLGALDKAFARGPFASIHARIAHSRLARDASDHLPLVVDLELSAPLPRTSLPVAPFH